MVQALPLAAVDIHGRFVASLAITLDVANQASPLGSNGQQTGMAKPQIRPGGSAHQLNPCTPAGHFGRRLSRESAVDLPREMQLRRSAQILLKQNHGESRPFP
jgi:hypothetical protein